MASSSVTRSRIFTSSACDSHARSRRPAATSTGMRKFSCTVSSGNTSVTWKVRAMPHHTRRAGRKWVTSWPSKTMLPDVGVKKPVIRLKKVVLPAPFGPMIARSSPGSTVIEISLTAIRLPKYFETFLTWSRLITPPYAELRQECRAGRTAPPARRTGRQTTSSSASGSTDNPGAARRSPRRSAGPRTNACRRAPP